jgi:hypothetical protein
VEEARRLGGLLMGVSVQAARPISLAKQWESIARQSVKEFDEEESKQKEKEEEKKSNPK